jgi:hypothetical protein
VLLLLLLLLLLGMVTCMCWSGPVLRTLHVPGMSQDVLLLLGMVTCMCWSGPVLRSDPPCPWDKFTCVAAAAAAAAAQNGHLHALQ